MRSEDGAAALVVSLVTRELDTTDRDSAADNIDCATVASLVVGELGAEDRQSAAACIILYCATNSAVSFVAGELGAGDRQSATCIYCATFVTVGVPVRLVAEKL